MGVSFLRGCDETCFLLGVRGMPAHTHTLPSTSTRIASHNTRAHAQALRMLEKAVAMGQPQAMTRMGHFYRTGPGTLLCWQAVHSLPVDRNRACVCACVCARRGLCCAVARRTR
jgi:hypothetical protein